MTIYDDGASHTISTGTFGAVTVSGGDTFGGVTLPPGTTLHFSSTPAQSGTGEPGGPTMPALGLPCVQWGGGQMTGPAVVGLMPKSGTNCVQADKATLDFATAAGVSLTGGSDGGTGQGAGHGLWASSCSISAAGTLTCRGGAGDDAGHGVVVVNPAAWSVTGLSCTGGNASTGFAGSGLLLFLSGAGALTSLTLPSTATYAAGSGASAGVDLGIGLEGSSSVTVPGGSFGSGSVALCLLDGSSVTFQGSGLSWSGGTLTARGQSGTLSGTISGVSVSLTVTNAGRTLSASGSGSSVTFGPAPITPVQHHINASLGTSVTTTCSATTAGHFLAAVVSSPGSPVSMPAGWVQAAAPFGGPPFVSLWTYPGNPGGITSVTATASEPILWVGEYSGLATPVQTLTAMASTFGSTTPAGGTVSPGRGPVLVLAAFANDNADTASSPTGGFSIVDQGNIGANNGLTVLAQVGGPGSYTAGVTLPSADSTYNVTAAFRQ